MGDVVSINKNQNIYELKCGCGNTHFEVCWYSDEKNPYLVCTSCENHIPIERSLNPD